MTFNKQTKTHKNPLEVNRENQRGAMFEEPSNPLCPVCLLDCILTKSHLTQKYSTSTPRERSMLMTTSGTALGINQLSQMLQRMCKEAGTWLSYVKCASWFKLFFKCEKAHSYWRPSLQSRKRWSGVLTSDQSETAPEKQQILHLQVTI